MGVITRVSPPGGWGKGQEGWGLTLMGYRVIVNGRKKTRRSVMGPYPPGSAWVEPGTQHIVPLSPSQIQEVPTRLFRCDPIRNRPSRRPPGDATPAREVRGEPTLAVRLDQRPVLGKVARARDKRLKVGLRCVGARCWGPDDPCWSCSPTSVECTVKAQAAEWRARHRADIATRAEQLPKHHKGLEAGGGSTAYPGQRFLLPGGWHERLQVRRGGRGKNP